MFNTADIKCVARSCQSEEELYYSAERFDLKVDFSYDEAKKCDICRDIKVRITNTSESDFKGVVHIKLFIDN